ncbi:hypothetical protein QQ045_016284 [Rhodiola kirilowii]
MRSEVEYSKNSPSNPLRLCSEGKAPSNNQMVSPKIQKDIVHCFSQEVIHRFIEEIGDDVFALLVDESSDVSYKEQMAMILRFVDKYGIIKRDLLVLFM